MRELPKFEVDVQSSLNELSNIWQDLGYSYETILERQDVVRGHIDLLMKAMVEEEEECKRKIIQNIESYLKERATLCKELRMEVPSDDSDRGLNTPIIEVERDLKEKLDEYRMIRAERLKCLEDLKSQEKELMESMGIARRAPILNSIPSEEELERYTEYLNSKKEDKLRLEGIFQSTRTAVVDIMTEMEIRPELDFEAVVFAGIDNFQLSQENMARLKELHQSLERRLQEAKALSTQLREQLVTLWDRLNEPYEHRDAFVLANAGHSSATIKALKTEIKRCEKKKRENIRHFVETVRTELVDWWEKCHYNDDQRAEFKHFHSDCFTEDLLELHEQEVERLKQFYTENRDIFALVGQFQEMWDRMIVLEDKAQQPNRFDNRGGQLLREEKERKTILRNLPKIEKELKQFTSVFEAVNGRPFLMNGERVCDFLQEKWDTHKENKEREKVARKMRNQSTVDGLSATKAHAGGVSMKRKMATPATSDKTKRGRVAPASSTTTSAARPVRRRSAGLKKEAENPTRIKKVARKIFNATRTCNNAGASVPDVVGGTHNAANVTSYTDFQDHLEKTKSSRSSTKNTALRERNTTAAPQPATRRPATPLTTTRRAATPLKTSTLSLARRTPVPGCPSTPGRPATGIPRLRLQTPLTSRSPATGTPRFTPARGHLPFLI